METENNTDKKGFGEAVHSIASAVAPEHADEAVGRFMQARRYAADKVNQLRRAAASKVDYVRQHAVAGWNGTCDKAKDLHHAGEEYVRANPTKATLITLGVGFILGAIIGRSCRR